MESRESCWAADGRAWKVDGRAQALVGPGLATPLFVSSRYKVPTGQAISRQLAAWAIKYYKV